ncbi:Disease resistance protein (CC-NBS-LRR class) family [Euphorbia peplus]|nr:Disease resistance protein (CC-NBS-LRR class) family [Euphorbia peplus]
MAGDDAGGLVHPRDDLNNQNMGDSIPKRTAVSAAGHHLLASEIVGEQFHQYVKDITSCLMDDHVSVIGIYGIGGVGKTLVSKILNNQLLESPTKFNHVFWVNLFPQRDVWDKMSASASPPYAHTVSNLQSFISKAAGVTLFNAFDETNRAALLSKALVEKKKSLLILDDVWDSFSLQDVGIPVGADHCTVLFTTRSLSLCRQFDCQRKFEIQSLQLQHESYELFMKILGKETQLSTEAEQISRSVADRCVGLPLAITITAKIMKGVTSASQWRSALDGIKQRLADVEIFQKLKMSYNYLKDPALKNSFLYCPLLVQDDRAVQRGNVVFRRTLAEYLVDEGLIKRTSRREELDEALTMLDALRDVGLLEITSRNFVKMNPFIRGMAVQIMEESRIMVQSYAALQDLPDEESWREYLVRVSLVCNQFKSIPSSFSPRCSMLSTLLLSYNHQLRSIGDTFFDGMPGLKVLDLSYTSIESLPSSACRLVKLTTLLLKACTMLRWIPSVAKLKALKKLDLSFSGVKTVPKDIEMLSQLSYFDLFTTTVKDLNPGILAGLSKLQFLRLPVFVAVKAEELACLSRLETLACSFYDAAEFHRYTILLEGKPKMGLDFKVGPGPIHYAGFTDELFNNVEDLFAEENTDFTGVVLNKIDITGAGIPNYFQEIVIVDCNEARSLCDFPPINGTSELEYFSINECDGLEFVLQQGQGGVEKLEYMELVNLKYLSFLLKKEATVANYGLCFSNLKRFLIEGCPRIKFLFPFHLMQNLKSLQGLCVIDCCVLESIFEIEEETENGNCSLPGLTIFRLKDLPELTGICDIPSGCFREIENCPKVVLLD